MNYRDARAAFDVMDMDAKDRVTRTFDLIRMESNCPDIYAAFSRAVESESIEIVRERFGAEQTEGST